MTAARPSVLLGAALLVALVTSILLYQYLSRVSAATPPVTMKSMAIAAKDLAWGTKLTSDMLREAPIAAEYVPDGAFDSRDALVGRILITHVQTNEAILE